QINFPTVAAHLFSRPVRSSLVAMAAWTVLDPVKEARAVLDEMAKHMADDPRAPLHSPPADVLRTLMAGNTAGQVLGKGNSSEVHACQSDSRYVIRTVRQQDEVEWQRELSRLRRVPALSVITTIFATSGRRSLMPRLWSVPRGALRTMEIIRLKYDISAALEKQMDKESTLPTHLDKDSAISPTITLPRFGRPMARNAGHGTLGEIGNFGEILPEMSAENLRTLCPDRLPGDLPLAGRLTPTKMAILSRPTLPLLPLPESRTTDMQFVGGLAHHTSRTAPPTPVSVSADRLPGIWGAGQEEQPSEIPDKSAAEAQAPPPSGAHTDFSAPVQNAIRSAAANLSAAISFAKDMEQSMPQHTHRSLALSLRATSDILREVSTELLNAARNEASTSAQDSEASDQQMAQADKKPESLIRELAYNCCLHTAVMLRLGLSHPKRRPGLPRKDDMRNQSLQHCSSTPTRKKLALSLATSCLHSKWAPFGVFGQLLDGLPTMQDSRHSSPSIDQPSDYKSIFFGAYSQGPLVGLRAQTRRYPMVSRLLNAVIYTLCGAHCHSTVFLARNRAMGLHSDPHKEVPNVLIPLSVFAGGQLFVESEEGDVCLDVQNNIRGHVHPITLPFLAFDAQKSLGYPLHKDGQVSLEEAALEKLPACGYAGDHTAVFNPAQCPTSSANTL
ncbi:unnamed protein product, partial [Symbiodinium necroappetens]